MADDLSDTAWDEYAWERFLQEQERRTEKYMGLLEEYADHPQRDEIIAREMGWTHLLGGESRDWEEEVEATFAGEDESESAEERVGDGSSFFGFEKHPLYRQAVGFSTELDEMFAGAEEKLREHPVTTALRSQMTLAAAKLAAALHDEDIDELGMSIAYLKRALRALTTALEATMQLEQAALIDAGRFELLRSRIFSVRDGIVSAMGEYRAEFRRRHGRR